MSIVLAAGALTGCSSGSEAVNATQGPTASAAPAVAAELDPVSFAAALKRPGTTVVDVRSPAEFAAGHLSGAVNLDVSSPDVTGQLAQLDPAGRMPCTAGRATAPPPR